MICRVREGELNFVLAAGMVDDSKSTWHLHAASKAFNIKTVHEVWPPNFGGTEAAVYCTSSAGIRCLYRFRFAF